MISKDLLSAVLGKDIFEISISDREARERGYLCINGVFVIFEDNRDAMINIYELAHKCKEWANKKGYILSSAFHNGQGFCEIKKETPERIKSIAWCPVDFDTEVEAIFSACQYILDNESNIKD